MSLRIITAIIPFVFSTWVWAEPIIEVKPQVELDMQDSISIGDIADFKGFSDSEIADLRSVSLGDAPERGESRYFSDVGLSQVFRHHLKGMQNKRGEKISVTIPAQVIVKRRTLRLQAADVEAHLKSMMVAQCTDCDFVI